MSDYPSSILASATATSASFGIPGSSSSGDGAPAPTTLICTASSSSAPHHLLAPFHHIQKQKNSKGVRTKMIKAFNDWIQLTTVGETKVDSIVGMLHNASLMVDDIEDGATLRRGQPVAHMVFGTALTLNCANHIYFAALADVMQLVDVSPGSRGASAQDKATAQANLVRAYTDELQELHIGQGLDIYWRDTFTCPTLEAYEAMVAQKTGGLFRLSLKLMLALRRFETAVLSPPPQPSSSSSTATVTAPNDHNSGTSDDASMTSSSPVPPQPFDLSDPTIDTKLIDLVNSFSVFFQVLDDYNNLRNEDYHKNKSFCEDLQEGKFSYLITHSILTAQRTTGDTRLYHALRQRPSTEEMKKFCLELLEETNSFEACKARLGQLKGDIMSQMKDLGGNAKLEKCLAELEHLGGL